MTRIFSLFTRRRSELFLFFVSIIFHFRSDSHDASNVSEPYKLTDRRRTRTVKWKCTFSLTHKLIILLCLFCFSSPFFPLSIPVLHEIWLLPLFFYNFFFQSVIFLRVFSTVDTVLCDCERVSVPRAHTAPRAYYIGRNEIDSLRNHATNTNVYIRSISGKPRSEGDLFFLCFSVFLRAQLGSAHGSFWRIFKRNPKKNIHKREMRGERIRAV